MDKVSIHIISYNQKDYIAEAILSAVNQDYENLEVVISDDASTDGTAEIVSDYQMQYPHRIIALLNKENVGVTRNANRALKACSGKYIAFQGGDDVLIQGKITKQVNWFEGHNDRVLCGHQVEVFYQNGSRKPHVRTRFPTKMRYSGHGSEKVIRYGTFGATSIMVRAEKIPSYGFDEEFPVVSDLLLWIEVLASGGEFGFIRGTYARYRRHDNNVTNNAYENLNEIESYLLKIANKYPKYSDACRYAFNHHIQYKRGVLLLRNKSYFQAKNIFLKIIKIYPLYVKAWIRLFQTLVRW